MEEQKKYCFVCGKELTGRQTKFCSKKCMGLGKQGYKACIVCGKIFKDSASNEKFCCSKECSKIHRQNLHKAGVYDRALGKMHWNLNKKLDEIGKENHWISKHWVISSPEGKVYECNNLLNFIREHQEMFDGTVKQAYDGFQKNQSIARRETETPNYTMERLALDQLYQK